MIRTWPRMLAHASGVYKHLKTKKIKILNEIMNIVITHGKCVTRRTAPVSRVLRSIMTLCANSALTMSSSSF